MNYINLLKHHNLKVTPQRLLVVESLAKRGHLNIDELYIILKDNFANISLATIYKNIHLMDQKHLIQEVKIPNKKNVYELKKQEHAHIVCTKCTTIEDVELDTNNITHQALKKSKFNIDNTTIIFNGTCCKCRT